MGYKDIINMDEIEKFYYDFVELIEPNKKEFCNGMRGLREFGDKLKSKKPKWLGRFIFIAEYFGVPFFNDITANIKVFQRKTEYNLNQSKEIFKNDEDVDEEQLLKEIIERYYPETAIEINKLLKKANTFLNFCKRKKEQIQIETYPQLEIETSTYEHHSDNFYSEDLPEITDINKSVLDTKYYLNMFIDVLIENLSEMVEKIKTEMLKFETQIINKSSSIIQNNQLLKLAKNNTVVSFQDVDRLKSNLLFILEEIYNGPRNHKLNIQIFDFLDKYNLEIPSLNKPREIFRISFEDIISGTSDLIYDLSYHPVNRNLWEKPDEHTKYSTNTIKAGMNVVYKCFESIIQTIEEYKNQAIGEIEISMYGHNNEDFEGSIEAEQADLLFGGGATPVETGKSIIDINIIVNAFLEESQDIIRDLIASFKNKMKKFEKEVSLKSTGSYFDNLLKLSSEFLNKNKKQACPKDMDSLKKLLIRILEKNEDNFNKNHDVIEKISSKIERNKVENRSSTFDLYKMCEILQHVKPHSIQSKITKINAFFITDALQEIKSIMSIYFEPSINELENLKIITLPITISTYGFGEEDAGRLEAEQAMNEFGNTSLNSFETGEQVIDLADIVNQINIETQNKLKEMIVEFNKLIDWFGRKYYWTDD